MKNDVTKAAVQEVLHLLLNMANHPAPQRIRIKFNGYTAEDVDCKYCLHFGGKSKGCSIAACCCTEEKQQTARRAAE